MKAQMFNFQVWIASTDERYLKSHLRAALLESEFNIEGFVDKQFKPYGYTALWLLSESHLAVHTFPEEGRSYVELSSCIEVPFSKFKKLVKADD